jgi:hypothetical protein
MYLKAILYLSLFLIVFSGCNGRQKENDFCECLRLISDYTKKKILVHGDEFKKDILRKTIDNDLKASECMDKLDNLEMMWRKTGMNTKEVDKAYQDSVLSCPIGREMFRYQMDLRDLENRDS